MPEEENLGVEETETESPEAEGAAPGERPKADVPGNGGLRGGGRPRDKGEEKQMRAAHLILFKRGRRPGARDWELQRRVGKDYEKVLEKINERLADLDVQVKEIVEPPLLGEGEGVRRYVAVLKGNLNATEARMNGWRIDNLAGLSVAIGLVMAKQGKCPRDELEDALRFKFGRWRPMSMVDMFVRSGYLREDDEGLVSLDWRTYAEVDLRELMTKLLTAAVPTGEEAEGEGQDMFEAPKPKRGKVRGWEEPPEPDDEKA